MNCNFSKQQVDFKSHRLTEDKIDRRDVQLFKHWNLVDK